MAGRGGRGGAAVAGDTGMVGRRKDDGSAGIGGAGEVSSGVVAQELFRDTGVGVPFKSALDLLLRRFMFEPTFLTAPLTVRRQSGGEGECSQTDLSSCLGGVLGGGRGGRSLGVDRRRGGSALWSAKLGRGRRDNGAGVTARTDSSTLGRGGAACPVMGARSSGEKMRPMRRGRGIGVGLSPLTAERERSSSSSAGMVEPELLGGWARILFPRV